MIDIFSNIKVSIDKVEYSMSLPYDNIIEKSPLRHLKDILDGFLGEQGRTIYNDKNNILYNKYRVMYVYNKHRVYIIYLPEHNYAIIRFFPNKIDMNIFKDALSKFIYDIEHNCNHIVKTNIREAEVSYDISIDNYNKDRLEYILYILSKHILPKIPRYGFSSSISSDPIKCSDGAINGSLTYKWYTNKRDNENFSPERSHRSSFCKGYVKIDNDENNNIKPCIRLENTLKSYYINKYSINNFNTDIDYLITDNDDDDDTKNKYLDDTFEILTKLKFTDFFKFVNIDFMKFANDVRKRLGRFNNEFNSIYVNMKNKPAAQQLFEMRRIPKLFNFPQLRISNYVEYISFEQMEKIITDKLNTI